MFFLDKILASKDRMIELVSKQSDTRVEELHELLNAIMRSQLAVHHQLISYVRSVLKSMTKVNKALHNFAWATTKCNVVSKCSVKRRMDRFLNI